MKVNTDGVLLGAAMTVRPSDRRMLDIGTGTGTIALMAAQRSSGTARIDAIDIDEPSATEAAANFKASPWDCSLTAHHTSLDGFTPPAEYDLIFSNPPYFEDSLTAPDQRKSTARHTSDGLSYRDIFEFAVKQYFNKGKQLFVKDGYDVTWEDLEDHVCIIEVDGEKTLKEYLPTLGLSVTLIRKIKRSGIFVDGIPAGSKVR